MRRILGVGFSPLAVDRLTGRLKALGEEWSHVKLAAGAAHQLDAYPAGHFDVIVLNSVIQYFPGVQYLEQVLQGAVRLLRPGGAIVAGDIRHLGLLDMLHASILLEQAVPAMPVHKAIRGLEARIAQEKELLLHPRFFDSWARQKGFGRARAYLKRQGCSRELGSYRYDVVLQAGEDANAEPAVQWDWTADRVNPERVAAELMAGPESLAIRGVPNARLAADRSALEMIRSLPGESSLAQVARRHNLVTGIEPESFEALASELGYDAEIEWSRSRDDAFDIIFSRKDNPRHFVLRPEESKGCDVAHVNRPSLVTAGPAIARELRRRLGQDLPSYMVPSRILPLPRMPLSPNGKLNRLALPDPNEISGASSAAHIAPAGQVEQVIAAQFAEVLRVERVGSAESFFELGGHSLLATQTVARIRSAFQIELPLRVLFEHPSVQQIARYVVTNESTPGRAERLASLWLRVQSMAAGEVSEELQRAERRA